MLLTLALGRPDAVRVRLERLAVRPVLGAAVGGAGLLISLGVAALPAQIAAHQRAVDYGISTQGFGSWLGDVGKSAAIGAVMAAVGGAVLIALVRRFGGRWWLPGSAAVAAIAVTFVWLAPVVLAPCSTGSRRSPPTAGPAPMCWRWLGGPGWRSGRSTASTPVAGFAR